MGDAEHGIEALGEIDGENVAVNSEMRDEKPYEDDRNERVGNIDIHGINLLAESFHHCVGCGVDIHDGDERSEDTNIESRFGAGVEGFSNLMGKADQNACHAD